MLSTEYYMIENDDLKSIGEVAPGHSAEAVLDALDAIFEDGSGSERHAFVRCKSVEYSTLDRFISDDGVADRLSHWLNEQSRRNLWMLQWSEPDETIYYVIWRNVLLNLENVLSMMPPPDFQRLARELEGLFEPTPGEETASAVRIRTFDKTPVGKDRDMDDLLREFLLAGFKRTGCSALTCLQWTE